MAQVELEGLSDDLGAKLEKMSEKSPGKIKDLLFVVGAMVVRNSRSLLPSMRQVCGALREALDAGAWRVRDVARVPDQKNALWASRYWKRVRSKCRAAKQKRQLSRKDTRSSDKDEAQTTTEENSGRQRPDAMVLEDEDKVNLLHLGMWIEALQGDLEFHQNKGERVGAHANQLMHFLLDMQVGTDEEAWQAVEALLVTYTSEEADERRRDAACCSRKRTANPWKEQATKWMGCFVTSSRTR